MRVRCRPVASGAEGGGEEHGRIGRGTAVPGVRS
jgi:hypothetical protein